MSQQPCILYCHCAYSKLAPQATRRRVLDALTASGASFHAVADLCELAARKDPMLAELSQRPQLRIAACFPRAVRWLFHWAGAYLKDDAVILNMRTQGPEEIVQALLAGVDKTAPQQGSCGGRTPPTGLDDLPPPKWIPWFPVIDYQRCGGCRQCLNFCLFKVYELDSRGSVIVRQPEKCKTNCPACARLCPHTAIIFPKHPTGPINGDEGTDQQSPSGKAGIDLSTVKASDIYQALRRQAGHQPDVGTEGST